MGYKNVCIKCRIPLLEVTNYELFLTIEGANHVNLYDNFDVIPFDKIQSFFDKNLK